MDNLSVALFLETAEPIGASLAYDTALSAQLGELARPNRTAGAVDLGDLLSSDRSRFKIHAAAHAPKRSYPPCY